MFYTDSDTPKFEFIASPRLIRDWWLSVKDGVIAVQGSLDGIRVVRFAGELVLDDRESALKPTFYLRTPAPHSVDFYFGNPKPGAWTQALAMDKPDLFKVLAYAGII